MPLTKTEEKVRAELKKKHGEKEGERRFWALVHSGKLGQASKRRHEKGRG